MCVPYVRERWRSRVRRDVSRRRQRSSLSSMVPRAGRCSLVAPARVWSAAASRRRSSSSDLNCNDPFRRCGCAVDRGTFRLVSRLALVSHADSTAARSPARGVDNRSGVGSLDRALAAREESAVERFARERAGGSRLLDPLGLEDADPFQFTIQQLWFCVRPDRIFVRLIAPGCVGKTLERPVQIAQIVDAASVAWRLIQVGRRVQIQRYARARQRWILRAEGRSEGGWLRGSPTRSLRQIAAWVTRRGRGRLPIGASISLAPASPRGVDRVRSAPARGPRSRART